MYADIVVLCSTPSSMTATEPLHSAFIHRVAQRSACFFAMPVAAALAERHTIADMLSDWCVICRKSF